MKLGFSRHIFEKKNQILNSIKIRREGAELFHADKETDRPTWRFSDSKEGAELFHADKETDRPTWRFSDSKDIGYKTCVLIFSTTFF